MKHTSVRPADEIEMVMDTYGNMLFRYISTDIDGVTWYLVVCEFLML